jgi:hypothetical protein
LVQNLEGDLVRGKREGKSGTVYIKKGGEMSEKMLAGWAGFEVLVPVSLA